MSALLSDGATRQAFRHASVTFHAPRRLRDEVRRHLPMIAARTGRPEPEVAAAASQLFLLIEWVPDAAMAPHWLSASRVLAATDPDDVEYLAAALAVQADAIWSHDRDFDVQTLVRRIHHPDELK